MPGPRVQQAGPLGEAAQQDAEGQYGLAVFGPDTEPLATEMSSEQLNQQILIELRRLVYGIGLLTDTDLSQMS